MPYVISCPHCKQQMQLADGSAGKQFRCPFCKNAFVAPAPAPQPSRPPPSVAAVARAPVLPTNCPACGAKLLEGAVSCMDCGYLIQGDGAAGEEGAPNLCPNPACGVANAPGERYCQRCSTPLPTAPGTMVAGRYRITKLLAM